MGQVLHGCATTTEAIRRAIQNSQASLRALAKRYGINQKTVAKWKERETVADLPTGPKEAKIDRAFYRGGGDWRTFMRAKPSRLSPCQVFGSRAFASSEARPIPHIRSTGLASTSTASSVANSQHSSSGFWPNFARLPRTATSNRCAIQRSSSKPRTRRARLFACEGPREERMAARVS